MILQLNNIIIIAIYRYIKGDIRAFNKDVNEVLTKLKVKYRESEIIMIGDININVLR